MPSTRPIPHIDRLDLLARILRDQPGITAAALAHALDVSVRTVFRDLDTLRERGYPIEAARGRGGGLRLHPGWGLGKVLLSRDEALCTLLGLAVSERLALPLFAAELGRSRRRIADAFPSGERRRIGPLRERIFVGDPASDDVRASYGTADAASMRRLQSAFVDEQVVLATYQAEDGRRSERTLEPHALLITWPAWYVLAFDHLRQAPRAFRLDRFVGVAPQRDTFRPRAREIAHALLPAGRLGADRL